MYCQQTYFDKDRYNAAVAKAKEKAENVFFQDLGLVESEVEELKVVELVEVVPEEVVDVLELVDDVVLEEVCDDVEVEDEVELDELTEVLLVVSELLEVEELLLTLELEVVWVVLLEVELV